MLSWLVASVTQASADAFAQATITTGLQNVSGLAFRVRRIEWNFPIFVGGDCNIQLALARKSHATFPLITDHSVIKMSTRRVELVTSGAFWYPEIESETFEKDEDLTLVEDPLYFLIDSSGTTASNSGHIRIGYESRKITETERLSLIAASLS